MLVVHFGSIIFFPFKIDLWFRVKIGHCWYEHIWWLFIWLGQGQFVLLALSDLYSKCFVTDSVFDCNFEQSCNSTSCFINILSYQVLCLTVCQSFKTQFLMSDLFSCKVLHHPKQGKDFESSIPWKHVHVHPVIFVMTGKTILAIFTHQIFIFIWKHEMSVKRSLYFLQRICSHEVC